MDNQQNLGGFCSKCGTPHKADALFCANCGNKFADQILPQFTSTKQASPAFNNFDGTNYSTFVNNNQPTPPPQAQNTQPQPQPQFVQPQAQYAQPVQPQSAPQFQHTIGANPKWKNVCCLLLFLAVLIVAIVPLFSFSYTDIDFGPNASQKYKDGLHMLTPAEDSNSVFSIVFGEKSIINRINKFKDTSEFVTAFIELACVIAFVIFTQIYAVKAIRALCKKDYARLSVLATKSVKILILVFIIQSIFGSGVHITDANFSYKLKADGYIGTSMGLGSIIALVTAVAIILACIIISSIKNKYSFYAEGSPRFIKKLIAFSGLLGICIFVLAENAQSIFGAILRTEYSGASSDHMIFSIPLLIMYTVVALMANSGLSKIGLDLLYLNNASDEEIELRKMRRVNAPNILFIAIILIISFAVSNAIRAINSINAIMELDPALTIDLIRPMPHFWMMLIAIVTYVMYKIFNSIEKRRKAKI